jgi:hypothetical protein
MSFRCVHRSRGAESADLVFAMYTVRKPVNRCPLQAAYVGATLSTLLALVTAEAAWAHVDVQPRLVEQGEITQLRVELPQLRPGPAPKRIEIEGAGIEVLSTRLQGRKGSETVWSVRVRANGPPGQVPLVLRALYAGGKAVEVRNSLTVVPGPEASFPWAVVAGGTLFALALALVVLRLARRRME